MLKRGKDFVRAVAESAGIVAPAIPDANKSAEEHRQSLVAAQGALESAEQALQAAHDRGQQCEVRELRQENANAEGKSVEAE